MKLIARHTAVPTVRATIFVGLKCRPKGRVRRLPAVTRICRAYCDEIGLCVTVTATTYIYSGGQEPGAMVGLINYPRFPASRAGIEAKAFELAEVLMDRLEQQRVTIVVGSETTMLTNRRLVPEAAK